MKCQRVLHPIFVGRILVVIPHAEVPDGITPDARWTSTPDPSGADDTYPSLIACVVRARQAIFPTIPPGTGCSRELTTPIERGLDPPDVPGTPSSDTDL